LQFNIAIYKPTYNLQLLRWSQVLCLEKYATVNACGLSRNMQHEQQAYATHEYKGLESRGEILRVAIKLIA